jgi:hypothetical protein
MWLEDLPHLGVPFHQLAMSVRIAKMQRRDPAGLNAATGEVFHKAVGRRRDNPDSTHVIRRCVSNQSNEKDNFEQRHAGKDRGGRFSGVQLASGRTSYQPFTNTRASATFT